MMKSYGQVTIQMKAFSSYFHRVSAVFQHFTKWNLQNLLNFDFGPFESESKDGAAFRALRRLPSTFPGLKSLEIEEAFKSFHAGYLFMVLLALKITWEGVFSA